MPSLPTKSPSRPWIPKAPPAERKPYQAHAERTALYDSPRWRRLRRAHLIAHPLCVVCERQGKLVGATVLDHIRPYRDGADFFDTTNHQGLCKSCHARKSAKEGHQQAYSKRTAPEQS